MLPLKVAAREADDVLMRKSGKRWYATREMTERRTSYEKSSVNTRFRWMTRVECVYKGTFLSPISPIAITILTSRHITSLRSTYFNIFPIAPS
jgi:hypothetical protein